MAIGYFVQPDGQRVTIRESLIAKGYACDNDIPGPPIRYRGEFAESDSARGTWTIVARRIRLSNGFVLTNHAVTGVWSMVPEAV